jgi:hypothetical protein
MVYEKVVADGTFYFAHVATDALRSEHLFATISHTQATNKTLPRTAPFLEIIRGFNHSLSSTIFSFVSAACGHPDFSFVHDLATSSSTRRSPSGRNPCAVNLDS